MHGAPADLDSSRFQGAALIQICLGEFQIQFHFHPKETISAEGKWEPVVGHRRSSLERRLHVENLCCGSFDIRVSLFQAVGASFGGG